MNTKLSVKHHVYALVLVAVLLFIGVAYAVLQRTLTIEGTTTVAKNTWNIHFGTPSVSAGSASASSPATVDGAGTGISFTVDLDNPGDYYEFYVDVINEGNIDAMVSSITLSPLTTAQQNYISYIVTYQDGVQINAKDALPHGTSDRIRVLVQYKDSATAATTETLNLTANITYVQADGTETARSVNSLYNLIKTLSTGSDLGVVNLNQTSVDNNTNGVYLLNTTASSANPIYYYRGNVDNNVIFNTFCWKMIRTTTTGGVKLIYNGVPTEGTCNATGTAAFTTQRRWSANNSTPTDASYATSEMKTYLETEWYATNMNTVSNLLEDVPFYNETSYTAFDTVQSATSTAGSYPAGARIWGDFSSWTNSEAGNTILLGTNSITDADTYTVGNGKLTYKVGLITSDEVMLAGGRGYSTTEGNTGANNSYYLYTGNWYWTMSPSRISSNSVARMINVDSNGRVRPDAVVDNTDGGVRPVISLKAGTVYQSGGNGSASNPYVIVQ